MQKLAKSVFAGTLFFFSTAQQTPAQQVDWVNNVKNKPFLDVRRYQKNSHSGGIQECLTSLASTGGTCFVASDTFITQTAKVSFPFGTGLTFALQCGNGASIVRSAAYPSGYLYEGDGWGTAIITNCIFQDSTATFGATIHIKSTISSVVINNVRINGYYNAMELDQTGNVTINNLKAYTTRTCFAGLWFHGDGAAHVPTNVLVSDSAVATTTCSALLFNGVDGAQFSNNIIGGGGGTSNTPIVAVNVTQPDYASGLQFHNSFFGPATVGSSGFGFWGNSSNIYMDITGGNINGGAGSAHGFDMGFNSPLSGLSVSLTGVKVALWGGSCVIIGATTSGEVNITGGNLNDCGMSGGVNSAAVNLAIMATFPKVYITGATITNPTGAGNNQYAVRAAGATNYLTLTGNIMCSGTVAPLVLGTTPTHGLIENNQCVNNEVTFANLLANAPNGMKVYCTDCKNGTDNSAVWDSAAANAGNGAMLLRENGAWRVK